MKNTNFCLYLTTPQVSPSMLALESIHVTLALIPAITHLFQLTQLTNIQCTKKLDIGSKFL